MLVEDMFESMYAAKGVGLAAPQIGIAKRIAVIDIASGEDPAQKLVLINPEILDRQGSQTGEEGCLEHSHLSRAGYARAEGDHPRAQCLRARFGR